MVVQNIGHKSCDRLDCGICGAVGILEHNLTRYLIRTILSYSSEVENLANIYNDTYMKTI